MNNEDMLKKILDNTTTVKTMITNKKEIEFKKEEKSKNAKQKAESKFKMVGTKLNESQLEIFKSRLNECGLNQSQYIKKLIESDLGKL
jgi:predicted DNA binding CopG/RHH family protein